MKIHFTLFLCQTYNFNNNFKKIVVRNCIQQKIFQSQRESFKKYFLNHKLTLFLRYKVPEL